MPYYRNFEKFRAVWMVGDHITAAPYIRDPGLGRPRLAQSHQPGCSPGQPRLPATQARRSTRPAGGVHAAQPGHVLASGHRQRLARRHPGTERGARDRPDRPHRPRRNRHRVGPRDRRRRHRVRHRLRDEQVPVADGSRRPSRHPERALGERRGPRLPRHHHAGFPNLFCIYGPNTNSNQGTIPTMGSELQMRYAVQCIEELFRTGRRSIDLKSRRVRPLQPAPRRGSGARRSSPIPRLDTYYINEHGRSSSQTCWTTLEYWQMTRRPDFADYRLSGTLDLTPRSGRAGSVEVAEQDAISAPWWTTSRTAWKARSRRVWLANGPTPARGAPATPASSTREARPEHRPRTAPSRSIASTRVRPTPRPSARCRSGRRAGRSSCRGSRRRCATSARRWW